MTRTGTTPPSQKHARHTRAPLLMAAAGALLLAMPLSGCSASAPTTHASKPAPTATAHAKPTSLKSDLPTAKEITATFGPGAVITVPPHLEGANPASEPTGTDQDACKRNYDTVFAAPYVQDANEIANSQNGTLKEEWELWQFTSASKATRLMSDIVAVDRSCTLYNGLGVEGYRLAASYAAGFETIDPGTKTAPTPVKIVWIFIRSGSTVALAVVNTDDRTTLDGLVGVEVGTLK